ncbi:AdoMet-homocysteine methyltransferase [Steccherinum ochraceum]|uniref:AdoMet-homocysteine methyltransferase n=1 Tax=Steccherinum ochraceum TaxID=92696 RepID=A0A4R0S1Y2_9APHY|nr:AdoMet-homocysteine methyltransferase [Steccherinum ochraceum]
MFSDGSKDDGDGRVYILDGGLGTLLESLTRTSSTSPLWSAAPVDTDDHLVSTAHRMFTDAGADVILTSTYQCAFSTFARAGHDDPSASGTRIMRKAVKLADDARTLFLHTQSQSQVAIPKPERKIRIMLSLGPYGATLSPTQEFDAFYPPPYGPQAYDPSQQKEAQPNAFETETAQEEERAVDALMTFHLERLRVFAEDEETWKRLDGIAFETIPLRREVTAIRRAMAVLEKEVEGRGLTRKPWWISVLYPEGKFPEKKRAAASDPGDSEFEQVSVADVVEALIRGNEDEGVRPDAIGINCTGMDHLGDLLESTTREVREQTRGAAGRLNLSLVLYPNGGDVWNPETGEWVPMADSEDEKAKIWASQLAKAVGSMQNEGVWRDIVVGGCCRTTPRDIEALAEALAG